MLCQKCNKAPASTHIKTIVNGQLQEYYLCSNCDSEQGYAKSFFNTFDIGNLHGSLLTVNPTENTDVRCPKCGISFDEITEFGKVGCAECYKTFNDKLTPMIQKLHGASIHKGKHPGGSALRVQSNEIKLVPVNEDNIKKKLREMEEAIKDQDFEKAAVLRDEIKELKKNESN